VAQFGVNVKQVSRIYDRYIESQLLQQQQATAYGDTHAAESEKHRNHPGRHQRRRDQRAVGPVLGLLGRSRKQSVGKLEANALLSTADSLAGAIRSYKQSLESVNTELNRSIADIVPLINDKNSGDRGSHCAGYRSENRHK